MPEQPGGANEVVRARRGGYLPALDPGALASLTVRHDGITRLSVRPGDFVFPGAPLARISPRVLGDPCRALIVGPQRAARQEVEFAVHQLTDDVGLIDATLPERGRAPGDHAAGSQRNRWAPRAGLEVRAPVAPGEAHGACPSGAYADSGPATGVRGCCPRFPGANTRGVAHRRQVRSVLPAGDRMTFRTYRYGDLPRPALTALDRCAARGFTRGDSGCKTWHSTCCSQRCGRCSWGK
ncbi:DUF2254 family protein [Deinococcus planocerae]|uniref:DUF2254 family protein n=1 Tax=Deinococcus planocerae TaxID=1737569 RepID=UPI000C7F29AE